MQFASVVVLALVCGAAFGAVTLKNLDSSIAVECQKQHGLSDAEVTAVDAQNFDDLHPRQKQMMWCYAQRANAIEADGTIHPENIKFSTPARVQACADKFGKIKDDDELLAFAMCILRRDLNLCNVIKAHL